MLETTLCYIFKDEKVLMLYRNKGSLSTGVGEEILYL